jgi:hypothetical protein
MASDIAVCCPHCGRRGSLPNGSVLPKMVRCPECQNKFDPTTTMEPPRFAAVVPEGKDCPFCGERVQAVAKKCRHCGEIIDVALRAAEEAKTLARSHHQPLIVNNNVSTSSSAAAAAVANAGYGRNSLVRSFIRFCVVISITLFGSLVAGGTGHTSLAGALIVACALMLLIGVPVYAARFFLRILFG